MVNLIKWASNIQYDLFTFTNDVTICLLMFSTKIIFCLQSRNDGFSVTGQRKIRTVSQKTKQKMIKNKISVFCIQKIQNKTVQYRFCPMNRFKK